MRGETDTLLLISARASLLLILILPRALAATSLSSIIARGNPLGIDFDPAPPPDKGPPLSAGALRNKAYLPAEIGGIVGGYVFVTGTIFILLWTVGRRLRREKRLSSRPSDVEMITAPYSLQFQQELPFRAQDSVQFEQEYIQSKGIFQSPVSPTSATYGAKNFSWPSPEKTANPYIWPAQGDTVSPVGSDPNVDQRVVMQDREQLARGLEDIYAHVMAQDEAKAAGVEPPPVAVAPMNYKSSQGPLLSAGPQRLSKNDSRARPSTLELSEKPQSRASSFIQSLKSPRKKKEMTISSPIATDPHSAYHASYASDEEPLSPRYISPPPPPTVPTNQTPYQPPSTHSRTDSADPSPVSPAMSIAEQLAASSLSVDKYSHRRDNSTGRSTTNSVLSQPPRKQSVPQISTASAINPRDRNALAPIKTQTASPAGSTRTLPFRAFDPPPGLASPTFSSMTKTTVLERTSGLGQALSPGIGSPWTAGAVPYSPYQPQTPLIPVTPRLVTKDDRKRMKRQEKRQPVQEMIVSEDEMWDNGY